MTTPHKDGVKPRDFLAKHSFWSVTVIALVAVLCVAAVDAKASFLSATAILSIALPTMNVVRSDWNIPYKKLPRETRINLWLTVFCITLTGAAFLVSVNTLFVC